jgi:NADH-quinone oxidoreductase subunit A
VLGQYLPLLALLVLAAVFAAGSFVASGLLAPRNPTEPKSSPYECGIVPSREAPERFPVRFFLVAMIFIVFDIEIIFFYPYAIARDGLGPFGLGLILVFSFAVFESFVYLIGNGALDWGPSIRRRGVDDTATAAPVPTAGVRLVGLEGRGVQMEEEVA